MDISRLLICMLTLQICSTATAYQDNNITPTFILTSAQPSMSAQARRELPQYLEVIKNEPAVMVVGTGEKYGVYDHMYYRVDAQASVIPDYIKKINTADFPDHFKERFDVVVFERLPLSIWDEASLLQAFQNAYNVLKKGGALILNMPMTLDFYSKLADTSDLKMVDKQLGIFHFPGNPLWVYLTEQSPFKTFQSNKHIEGELQDILIEKLIKPILLRVGFKTIILEHAQEEPKYWKTPQKNDARLLKIVK